MAAAPLPGDGERAPLTSRKRPHPVARFLTIVAVAVVTAALASTLSTAQAAAAPASSCTPIVGKAGCAVRAGVARLASFNAIARPGRHRAVGWTRAHNPHAVTAVSPPPAALPIVVPAALIVGGGGFATGPVARLVIPLVTGPVAMLSLVTPVVALPAEVALQVGRLAPGPLLGLLIASNLALLGTAVLAVVRRPRLA